MNITEKSRDHGITQHFWLHFYPCQQRFFHIFSHGTWYIYIYIHIHMIWCFFLCREVAWELSSPCAERVASMLWQWLDDWRVFWCGEDEGSKRNIFMGTRHFMNSCDSGEHEGCFFLGGGIMSSEWHKNCVYTWCCPMRIGEKFTDLVNDFEACALWNPSYIYSRIDGSWAWVKCWRPSGDLQIQISGRLRISCIRWKVGLWLLKGQMLLYIIWIPTEQLECFRFYPNCSCYLQP